MEKYLINNTDHYILLDTNVSTTFVNGHKDIVFTETLVAMEKAGGYFYNTLSKNHILASHTRSDFREEGGTMTLKAFDSHGSEASISYYTGGENVYCGNCNAPISGTLTSSDGVSCNVCQHLSPTDFSLLVRATGFSWIFTLITDEGCLGWSSALSGSASLFRQNKWYNYFYV